MKRTVLILAAVGLLNLLAACTPEDSADDQQTLYEQGTDKDEYTPPPNG